MTRLPILFSALALAFAGCGDSHSMDDDAGGISFMDSGPGTDAGGGGTDAGGGGTDAGGGGDDGGGGFDAGGGGTDGGGGGSDGGAGVDCMGMVCEGATPQCCIMTMGGSAMASCIPADEMCMGIPADCDGPEDCSGTDICCAMLSLAGSSTSCIDASMCTGFTSFELCHAASDCTTSGDMCCPFMGMGFSAAVCSPTCMFGPPPAP